MSKENKIKNPNGSKWLDIRKALKYASERDLLGLIGELLQKNGFAIASGASTAVDKRPNQDSENALKSLLVSGGVDAETAMQRLMVERFVLQVVPV